MFLKDFLFNLSVLTDSDYVDYFFVIPVAEPFVILMSIVFLAARIQEFNS